MSLTQKKGLLCLMIFSLVSCTSAKFNPDFYSIDKYNLLLVNAKGSKVPIKSDRSSRFACLNEEKILELLQLLDKSYYFDFDANKTNASQSPLKGK